MHYEKEVLKIREFNRFYTSIISVLDQSVLDSGFSLAEARALFEVGQLQPCTARNIMEEVNIDEGYLSRILQKLELEGWIVKEQSEQDRRKYQLRLTEKGETKVVLLESLANTSTGSLISSLSAAQLSTLLKSMGKIQELLSPSLK